MIYIAFCLLPSISSSAKKVSKAKIRNIKQVYLEWLNETIGDPTGKEVQCVFFDMNNDKIPELLWTEDGGFHVTIWAYVNGTVKKIDWIRGAFLKIYPTRKIYFHGGTSTGQYWRNYCKFDGEKSITLTEKYGNDCTNAVTGKDKPLSQKGKMAPYRYSIGNKVVSKKKYNKYIKKLLKGAKGKEINWKNAEYLY